MTPGKILILEDDLRVANVYASALREDGHNVTVCGNMEQAREHLRHEIPDALVTDVRLGEYNGLQMALMFRRTSPDGRVVVVTGYDDAVLRKDVEALQGCFLLKPIRIAQLKDALYARDAAPSVTRH